MSDYEPGGSYGDKEPRRWLPGPAVILAFLALGAATYGAVTVVNRMPALEGRLSPPEPPAITIVPDDAAPAPAQLAADSEDAPAVEPASVAETESVAEIETPVVAEETDTAELPVADNTDAADTAEEVAVVAAETPGADAATNPDTTPEAPVAEASPAEDAEEALEVAAAEPVQSAAEDAVETAETAETAPVSENAAVESESVAVETASAAQDEPTTEPVAEATETAATEAEATEATATEAATTEAAETEAAETEVTATEPAETELAETAPAETGAAETEPVETESAAVATSGGAGDEAAPADAPLAEVIEPTFDIIRIDGSGSGIVAGRAEPGSTVQILSEGAVELATVEASATGEFVAFIQTPSQDEGQVLSLSAQLGGQAIGSEQSVLVLPGQSADTDAPLVVRADGDDVRVVQPSALGKVDGVTLDSISYDEAGAVKLSGRAAAAGPIRIYVDGEAVGAAEASAAGTWGATLDAVKEGRYILRVDALNADGSVSSRAESPFQRVFPTAEQRKNPTQITVQPGNTLWVMAVDRYGDGLLYTQIFQANSEAIRDPDLIYPGQIFALPDEEDFSR